jgi:hypothetical protein
MGSSWGGIHGLEATGHGEATGNNDPDSLRFGPKGLDSPVSAEWPR